MEKNVRQREEQEKPRIPRIVKFLLVTEFVLSYITTTQFCLIEDVANVHLKRTKSDILRELNFVAAFSTILSLFPAWLADCYVEKYWVFCVAYVILCCWPVSLLVLVFEGLSVVVKCIVFNVVLFLTLVYYSVEPVRNVILSEQMELPGQERNIPLYFSLLLLARNMAGTLATTLLTSVEYDTAFLNWNCTLIIFLYIVYVIVFALIKKKLKGEDPIPLMYWRGIACLLSAVRNWIISWSQKRGRRKHLIDYAGSNHDIFFVYAWKAFTKLFVFCMISIFFIVTELIFRNITASQIKRLVPLEFLPQTYRFMDLTYLFGIIWFLLWDLCIQPILSRYKIRGSILQLFMVGFIITGLALVASMMVEIGIQKTSSMLPGVGYGQMRVYNAEDFVVGVKFHDIPNKWLDWVLIPPRGMWTAGHEIVNGNKTEEVTMKNLNDDKIMRTHELHVFEKESVSYIILDNEVIHVEGFDPLIEGPPGMNDPLYPRVYVLCGLPFCFGQMIFKNKQQMISKRIPNGRNQTNVFTLPTGVYNVTSAYSDISNSILKNIQIKVGGVYSILLYLKSHKIRGATFFTLVQPNQLSIAVTIPQIFLFTSGYLLTRVNVFVFMYTQAPSQLRCTFWNFGYYSYAVSYLIVFLDQKYWHPRTSVNQIVTFLLFHFAAVCFFFFYSMRYVYQTWSSEGAEFRGFSPLATRHLPRDRKHLHIFGRVKLRRLTMKSVQERASIDTRMSIH